MMKLTPFYFLFLMLVWACSNNQSKTVEETEVDTYDNSLAIPHPDWVQSRVEETRARLEQSEAGKIIWQSMERHGGLATWFNNGPIYFRFNYRPVNPDLTVRDSYQLVDTWSVVARHQTADDQGIEFGWDGQNGWKLPAEAELAINPRFWSTTPYYFIGLPFVLGDRGVILEQQDDIAYNEKAHFVIKAGYQAGVGDAQDYYILYLDQQDYRLSAIRYIVSYKGFFPDGGHSPEKLMTYEGEQVINGITLPERHSTYTWSDKDQGDLVTNTTVSDVEFRPNTPKTYFNVPEGSDIMEGY